MKVLKKIYPLAFLAGAIAICSRVSAAEVLVDQTGFISGQQSFVLPLNISGPGTLTITLTNVAWPEALASLNLVVGTANGLMGHEMGAGTESFDVTGGLVFAQWFGTAQGPLNKGLYSLNVTFAQSMTPVPLPAPALMLGSGLALLALWLRKQGVPELHSLRF